MLDQVIEKLKRHKEASERGVAAAIRAVFFRAGWGVFMAASLAAGH